MSTALARRFSTQRRKSSPTFFILLRILSVFKFILLQFLFSIVVAVLGHLSYRTPIINILSPIKYDTHNHQRTILCWPFYIDPFLCNLEKCSSILWKICGVHFSKLWMKGLKEIIKKKYDIYTIVLFKIYSCYLLTTESHDELKNSRWEMPW